MKRIMPGIKTFVQKAPVLSSVLFITAILLLFYSNSFTADWHYDDFHHIKENINIRKLSNIPNYFNDATTFSRSPQTRMYRPLLMSTHAFNYAIGIWTTRDGYDIRGYHVVNFLFHIASTLLIFFIMLFLFKERITVPGLDPHLPALFAALLFGLNTINTETVVYVSSRSSGMATALVLMAFYLYLKGSRLHRSSIPLLLASSLFFFCGMLSKEEAIMLPAFVLYYELFLNREWMAGRGPGGIMSGLAARLTPMGVAALVFLWIREVVLRDNLLKLIISKGGTPAASNLTSQLATQSRAWIYYIREWLWPTSLSIDKPFAISRTFGEPKVVISLLLIAAILALALLARKKHPAVAFGTLWWFTGLVPTSIFRLNVPINDHRLYLSGFGLALVFTYVASRLYVRFRQDGGAYLMVFSAVCLSTLLLMGLGTFKRNMAFATEESIWKDVILKDSKSVRGYNNLGIYYEQQGELDKAAQFYNQTVKLAPMFPNPYINLGNVFHKKKEYEKASQFMSRAIQLDPASALAYYNHGNILREWGKEEEAIEAYRKSLELNPRYIEAANNMANIHFKNRRFEEAIRYYGQALQIDPTFAMSYYNIGLAYENLQRRQEAMENFRNFTKYWLGSAQFLNIARQKIELLSRMQDPGSAMSPSRTP